jgi:hypothetical protein
MMDRAKVLKFMDSYQQKFKYQHNVEDFKLAICQVQLGNYADARQSFERSGEGMFKFPLWKQTGQPHWLVDICVLAGRADLYLSVMQELETYKANPLGKSLAALYAYALMELLLPSGNDITRWIQGLLEEPKVKRTFAMGQTIQAIIEQDQFTFNGALANLLKAHEGKAKHGNLRWTAEGLLCMPAMSLAYVALKRNFKVEIDNDYFSIGYLEYLLKHERE